MLKAFTLAGLFLSLASPAFAHNGLRLSIRCLDANCSDHSSGFRAEDAEAGVEHEHDPAEEAREAYRTAVDNHFFLEGGTLPDDQVSFVLLPDGTHYVLDSKFYQATQELAKLLEEHDHDHGNPNETYILAPWQRLADKIYPGIEALQTKHFWVKLSAKGIDLVRRYGVPAAVIVGSGELIEHGPLAIPVPLGCAGIYTAGVFSGKHTLRFWNLARYQFPLEETLGERTKLSAKQWAWNWRYWRAMRQIYNVGPEHQKLLTEPEAKMAAYILAQEKSAFLEMQLSLASQAVDPWATTHAALYYGVSYRLTTIGQAIDRYTAFMVGLAMTGKDFENAEALKEIDEKFQKFFSSLKDFIDTVEKGSVPLTSLLGQEIWRGPRQLKRDIRNLQKSGCEAWLKPGDASRS